MSEVQALLTKARRYLKSADLLLADGDYESAASRTYYAMFYSVEAILLTKNLTFSSHRGVIGAFGEQFIKTGVFPKELGRELNRAFEMRQLGDYESNQPYLRRMHTNSWLAAGNSAPQSSSGSVTWVGSRAAARGIIWAL
jgi:uncharacterized protein (UPF0332 family)